MLICYVKCKNKKTVLPDIRLVTSCYIEILNLEPGPGWAWAHQCCSQTLQVFEKPLQWVAGWKLVTYFGRISELTIHHSPGPGFELLFTINCLCSFSTNDSVTATFLATTKPWALSTEQWTEIRREEAMAHWISQPQKSSTARAKGQA